jgi:hypothetical protein
MRSAPCDPSWTHLFALFIYSLNITALGGLNSCEADLAAGERSAVSAVAAADVPSGAVAICGWPLLPRFYASRSGVRLLSGAIGFAHQLPPICRRRSDDRCCLL